tara:strand:+ start:489 stop:1331 length:843 start_codon:yes stop_codon:yes gene_type:complete
MTINIVPLTILCSVISIVCIILFFTSVYLGCPKIKNTETYISYTTIPNRIKTESFYYKTKEKIGQLCKNQILILNIPDYSLKGQKYIVPKSIQNLQSDKFIINNCGKDEGPITKLLPVLRNENISEESNIIIIDDDLHYKENMFRILQNSIDKNPNHISLMCNNQIMGFKSFGFKKKKLMGLLDLKIPKVCRKIDDWVLHRYIHDNKIKTKIVYYFGKATFFTDLLNMIFQNGTCSINTNKHIDHWLISKDRPTNNKALMFSTNRIKTKNKCNTKLKIKN